MYLSFPSDPVSYLLISDSIKKKNMVQCSFPFFQNGKRTLKNVLFLLLNNHIEELELVMFIPTANSSKISFLQQYRRNPN